MDLTETEKQIIQILRQARPFEQVIITKDKAGKPNTYLVVRTQKFTIGDKFVNLLGEDMG